MNQVYPKFSLRWCFEYSDHKPIKYGMWSQAGDFDSEKAWCQSKDNLLRATIQGKNRKTREIVTLASVNGQDFVNFQWMASAVMPGASLKGSVTMPSRIMGLMLVSRNQKVKIYDGGQCEVEEHNIDYGRINLAGFGR